MLTTSTLTKFLNGELTNRERTVVQQQLIEHPHYREVLQGLSNMQQEVGSAAALEKHFQSQKNSLRAKIFKH